MKIGIVSEYYYPLLGGISEHVHFFSRELSRLSHAVTIITSNSGFNPYPPPASDVEIIRLGRGVPFYSNGSFANITLGFGLKRKLKEIFKSKQFDVVHIQAPTIPVLPALTHLTSTGPTVGTCHTYFEKSWFYHIHGSAVQDALENLDGRIAVSPLVVDSLKKYFEVDFRIIPNGVDIDYFSKPGGGLNKFNDGKTNILFLARLDPRNGLEQLLKAFEIVYRQNQNTRLIVVGDGPLKFFYERTLPSYLKPAVFFEGYTRDLRPDYYALSNIFCFPVQKASFGVTLLEAMAAGTPIVCSDLLAFHDLLGESACRYMNSDNTEQLARVLIELADNPTLGKKLAENAKERVKRYSWSEITQEVLAYYREILKTD